MLLDKRNEFCDATALNTGGAASYLIGNVIDLGLAGRNIGNGEKVLELEINVDTLPTSTNSTATAAFHLVSDAQEAIAVDGSATYHFSTKAFAISEMAAGTRLVKIKLPSGNYERYLGILQTTAVQAFTGGKVNAFLTEGVADWKAYADNVA